MGIHDRDWYQDWWAKKHGVTKHADFRQSATRAAKQKARDQWSQALYRVIVGLLALFGALTLAKKYLLPLL